MKLNSLKKALASAISAALLLGCTTIFANAQTNGTSIELQSCQLVDSNKTLIAYARLGTVNIQADKEVGLSVAMDGNFDHERYDLSNKYDGYGKLKVEWVNNGTVYQNNDQYVKLSLNVNNKDLSNARFFLSYAEQGQRKVYDSNGQQGVVNYSTKCIYGKSGVSITNVKKGCYGSKEVFVNVNCAPHKGVKSVNLYRIDEDGNKMKVCTMYDKDFGDVKMEDGCLQNYIGYFPAGLDSNRMYAEVVYNDDYVAYDGMGGVNYSINNFEKWVSPFKA